MRQLFVYITIILLISACASSPEKKIKTPVKVKDGVIEEFWDDSSLKGRGSVSNFEKSGKWTLFVKGSGGKTKLAEGNYTANQQNGEWIYFYAGGETKLQGSFENGQKTGEWTEFYLSGKVLSKCKYAIKTDNSAGIEMKIGSMEGQKITYFESGKVQMEEVFQNGLKKGKNLIFYENGQTKEVAWFEENLKSGKFNVWHENGNLKIDGFMNKDKPVGKWTFYFENNAKQMEGKFENGMMSGSWKTYFQDGKTESFGEYKDSKKTGVWTFQNQKGQITQKLTLNGDMVAGKCWIYENGKLTGEGEMSGLSNKPDKNGAWIEFFANGKVQFEGSYMMGKKEGKFKEYYPSGVLQSEGEYMMGQLNGQCTFYKEDGSLDNEKSGNYMIGKKFNL